MVTNDSAHAQLSATSHKKEGENHVSAGILQRIFFMLIYIYLCLDTSCLNAAQISCVLDVRPGMCSIRGHLRESDMADIQLAKFAEKRDTAIFWRNFAISLFLRHIAPIAPKRAPRDDPVQQYVLSFRFNTQLLQYSHLRVSITADKRGCELTVAQSLIALCSLPAGQVVNGTCLCACIQGCLLRGISSGYQIFVSTVRDLKSGSQSCYSTKIA